MISVRYVGSRSSYTEGAYGSRITFKKGQSLLVPDDLAEKLLRHPDQYVTGDDQTGALATIPAQAPEDDTQDLRDQVMQMPPDALLDLAKNDYGIHLDKRLTVDTMRRKVVALIDQYGAV